MTLNFTATNGKTNFHESTVAERRRIQVAQGKALGHDPVPTWSKPYTGR